MSRRILYVDCFSGVSGDMFLGALVDLGVEAEALEESVRTVKGLDFRLKSEEVKRNGIRATHIRVEVSESAHVHRHLPDILEGVEGSSLSSSVKERVGAVFNRLADAEANVHGITREKVHFHEVGAVDSIVDIVGTVAGLEQVDVSEVVSSPINVGSGLVECAHGTLPVPAPATLELLKGFPTYSSGPSMELTTPTGAAILTTVVSRFGGMPAMEVGDVGYGAGTGEPKGWSNVLRLTVGESAKEGASGDSVLVIETNIDDMNPELYESVMSRLFEAGALDVFFTPVQMKKNRPGVVTTVLCRELDRERVVNALFEETGTFGMRIRREEREILQREWHEIEIDGASVRIKVGRRDGKVVAGQPEYEDCKRAAEEQGVPTRRIYEEALRRAEEIKRKEGKSVGKG